MRLRYAGVCRICEAPIARGATAIYEPALKKVRCLTCLDVDVAKPEIPGDIVRSDDPDIDFGTAGRSAWHEYERRRSRDEEKIRAKWGRLGGIAYALSDEKQSTTAWKQGAIGETRLGARLDGLRDDGLVVMHDRRIPKTRGNLDHLVVTSNGVWLIDAKRYKGRPEKRVKRERRQRVEQLYVGSRNCTTLIETAQRHTDLIKTALSEAGFDTPVFASLCFIEADWGILDPQFRVNEVLVTWPRKLVRELRKQVEGPHEIEAVTRELAEAFPAE